VTAMNPTRNVQCVFLCFAFLPFCTIQEDQYAGFTIISDFHVTQDAKKLEGRWRIFFFSTCDGDTGEIKDLIGVPRYVLSISPIDKIKIEVEGRSFFEWSAKYDFKKKPILVDLVPVSVFGEKKESRKVNKALLKIDGDHLIIHVGNDSRPEEFTQHKGLTSMLIRCEKLK
jgi:hypothetical protein